MSILNKDPRTTPEWSTQMAKRWPGGVCQGTNQGVWLYRKVPLGPVDEAVDTLSSLMVADPVMSAMRELERMARVRVTRRRMVRSTYREVHFLLINVPRRYTPDEDQPLRTFLSQQHPRATTDHRVLLMGVKIKDDLGGSGGWSGRVDSFVQTFTEGGGVPMGDYQADIDQVDRALRRAGLNEPGEDDFKLADAWWNMGQHSETPVLPHDDHLHVFASHAAMAAAWPLESTGVPCSDWPRPMRGHHTLSLVAFRDLEFVERSAESAGARWASAIRMQGAAAISIRGLVEPAKVTRDELRRNRNKFRGDIREQRAADKMERTELIETSQSLAHREAEFSGEGANPSLIDTSVLVALNGADENGSYDARGMTSDTASWSNMLGQQDRALEETMLCSPVRTNPNLKDVPAATIAYSGLPSLSVVGDREGALLGFTERDHQPAYISHKAAYVADSLPMLLVAGATGSGKLLDIRTKIPTPLSRGNTTGWTTMGELRAGDSVLGRDGKPCKVTYVSPLNPTPDLYEVTLSDGQQLTADYEHQWVISSFAGRNGCRKPKRVAALEAHRFGLELAETLDRAAGQFDDDQDSTLDELMILVRGVPGAERWQAKEGLYAALQFVGCPTHTATRTRTVTRRKRTVVKTDPARLFSTHQILEANLAVWKGATGSNAVRWGAQTRQRIAAAEAVIAQVGPEHESTAPGVVALMRSAGCAVRVDAGQLRSVAYKAGVLARDGFAPVTIPMPAEHATTWEATCYPTAVAFKALAARVRQQHHHVPRMGATELRMTTGEMLARGVLATGGASNFAIRVTRALELPEADLPVPAYTMGAWLGDGHSNGGGFTGIDPEVTDAIKAEGFEVRHRSYSTKDHYIQGLSKHLRAAGVLNDKHIPALYLRASHTQRLALLTGLMDTDGSIDAQGSCELTLCNGRLATDALELIRSLGIKVAMHASDAGITQDGVHRVTGTRYRMVFTTDQPVFRLPRKAERLPTKLRETQQWLYIKSIKPVTSFPGKCIQVDSVDNTYLASGFIPQANTLLLLYLAYQWAQMDPAIPQVIVDPKALALDTRVPTPTGWTCMEDVQVGDQVIGRDGKPCSVTHKSRVFTSTESTIYEFGFADGQAVRADLNHQWVVRDKTAGTEETLTTEALLRRGFENFEVPMVTACAQTLAVTGTDRDTWSKVVGDSESGTVRTPDPDGTFDMMTTGRSLGFWCRMTGKEEFVFDRRAYQDIAAVDLVASEPAQCIRVDSPDHTYLIEDFLVTHNTGSDHSDTVLAAGGRVFSLDDLAEADGVFDPLRFAGNAQAGVEVATSMLLQVDPWKEGKKQYETDLQVGLKYGVDNGATCIGQALQMAHDAEIVGDDLVGPIFKLVRSNSFFATCVGMDPQGDGLRVSSGINLIKVGNTHLDLPHPGSAPESMNQRVAVALVRMMVFGSAMAMTGRNGVLHFDEAWVALSGGATEVERLGRLARSQTVLPVLYTQRVSDAVNAGLSGYISRGLIMHISDEEEAAAACALFKLEPELRVPRITRPATQGGITSEIEGSPDYASLKALKEPKTGRVKRGAVAIYKDLAGRAVPVVVDLPEDFLALASTNPEDIARKQQARQVFEAGQRERDIQISLEASGSAEYEALSSTGGAVGDESLDADGLDGRARAADPVGASSGTDGDDLEEIFS